MMKAISYGLWGSVEQRISFALKNPGITLRFWTVEFKQCCN